MLFDRAQAGDLAVLVHIDFPEGDDREDPREFEELVISAGANPLVLITGVRSVPDPKLFVGSGKVAEIKQAVIDTHADVVLFNHALRPSQERNLERELECRVLDRTGLILDIFAQRARTHEGKLQVELAQLNYQSTRLVRGWTHLERQKGGIGLRGPGETQLESDRRLLQARINSIQNRLKKVEKQRDQSRRSRTRSDTPTVSLVGYTNAGKSTLFNYLTEAEVYAADQMFATLDPTLRKLHVSDLGPVILADTVGFIRHLPHRLVDAFKATLQETIEADLLLHVIDAASNERDHNIEQVETVLTEIGAEQVPILEIYNKIDLMEHAEPSIERNSDGTPRRVWVSARTGHGTELIGRAIAEILGEEIFDQQIRISPAEGQLRALFFAKKAVLNESYADNGDILLHVRLQQKDMLQVLTQAGVETTRFVPAPEKEFYEH
ncbi:ribosome rescue GTPase HflX [Gynuella sp.]|uniref:ribosome rescue GTPase HflX n=1 Tax=Gynuella sp. TaxID=2969146 RepID=UPI003D14CFD2